MPPHPHNHRAAAPGPMSPDDANFIDDFDEGAMFAHPQGAPQHQPAPQAHAPHAPQPQASRVHAQAPHPHMHQPPQQPPQHEPFNPLLAYTRMPGMHIKLPSNGCYMPQGSVTTTATGEIPVYPMRAADEVMLKNPDALMSGMAVEQMLASCIPAIRHPQLIAMPDLDVLFLAVRAASYGDKMEFEVRCPKCKAENVFEAHLPSLLHGMTDLPSECPVRLTDEVVAYMRPYNLRNATQVAVATFEETRRLQAVQEESDELKSQAMTMSLKRITELSARMMTDCVMVIVTPQGPVTDRAHIAEFMGNIPRGWTKKIETALKALNDYGMNKTISPVCTQCDHTWETELEFDPGSFFGQGS